MHLEKFSIVTSRRRLMAAVAEKLSALSGSGRMKEREWRLRVRLNWHHKPQSTIRHLLYHERQVSAEEAREIEAAHMRYCAEKVRENVTENAALYASMRQALAAMEQSDPEFYRPRIEAVRELLLRGGDTAGTNGGED